MTTFAALLRALLAATFTVSAVAKLLDRPASREAVKGFGTPKPLVGLVTTTLPLVELATAGLMLGPRWDSRTGSIVALAMLAAFTLAIVNALLRGKDVECRCFGALSDKPLGWGSVVRNVLLAAAAALILIVDDPGDDVFGWLDARTGTELTVGGLLLALSLAVALLTKLLLTLVRKHGEVLLRLDALETAGPQTAAETFALRPIRTAADFRLPNASSPGQELGLTDLVSSSPTGHQLLLFMAESCAPCTGIAPEVARWAEEHAAVLPLAVIGSGEAKGLRAKFRKEPTFPLLVTPTADLQGEYGVDGTPSAVVVDRTGMVVGGPAAGADEIRTLVRSSVAVLSGGPAPQAPTHVHQIEARPLSIGDPAPAVSVLDPSGAPVALADQLVGGKVILFWDTLCGFCELLTPELTAWEGEVGDPPVVVVTRDPVGTQIGLAAPAFHDQGGAAATAFGSPGTPSAIRVDHEGRIASSMAAGGPEVMLLLGQAVERVP